MQVGDRVTYIFPGDARITAMHERNSGTVLDLELIDGDGGEVQNVGVESVKAWDGTYADDQWISVEELRTLLQGNPWEEKAPTCEECGVLLPDADSASAVSTDHTRACSLHPDNIV